MRKLCALAAAVMMVPGGAQAAVTYNFILQPTIGLSGGFSLTLPGFTENDEVFPFAGAKNPQALIMANRIPVGQLSSCSAGGSNVYGGGCADQWLIVGVTQFTPLDTPYDVVGFGYGSGSLAVFYFENGTFSKTGTFLSSMGAGVSRLTITTDSAVTEPSTWLMLVSGFAISGIAIRRGRRGSCTGKHAPRFA